MYTPSKAYVRKFSSGTILALLAFSGFLVLVPAIAPIHAANAAQPKLSYITPTIGKAAGSYWVGVTLTDPASNQFSLTSFVVQAPAGWIISDCDWETGFFDSCSYSSSSAAWTFDSSGAAIPPGSSDTVEFYVTFPTGTYPFSGTFGSTVQDQSSSAYYAGPTFKLWVVDPSTSLTLTPDTGTSFTAGGSPVSFTATLSPAYAGLPIYLQNYYGTGSLSASTVTTGSSGSASFTFTPSNTATSVSLITEYIYGFLGNPFFQAGSGNTGIWDYSYDIYDFDTVATVAASPASVSFCIGACPTTPFPSTYYATGHTTITLVLYADVASSTFDYTVADRFGNPDAAGVSGASAKFTALSGGGFFAGSTTTTTETIAAASGPLSYEYSQGSTFGTIGLVNVVLTGTYSSSPFTVSGTTGQISTSTFDTASNLPTVDATTVSAPGCSAVDLLAYCQMAGKTATVDYSLTLPQKGVPVEFSVDPASTAVNGDGGFAASVHTWAYTDSTGKAIATYAVDTGAGAIGTFNANVSKPINGPSGSSNYIGGSGPSVDPDTVVTIAGAPATFHVEVKYTSGTLNDGATASIKNSVNGTTVYVNVFITDAYGNYATNPGPNQIQVSLTPSAGVLSATTVYITSGAADTKTIIGAIAWTLPPTFAKGITLTASGVLSGHTTSGKATVNTVSAVPTFAVTSPAPVSGVIYSSSTAVVFLGQANASIGYPTTVQITSVGYKIGSNPWQTAPIVAGNAITWSIAAVFSAGLNTIMFNATDGTNTFVSTSYKVLVDTSAPDINFVTANNANLSSGATVTATIVENEGDLNSSSVSAVATNLDTAATKTLTVAVTGTNNLGHSVSYGVTLSGLVAGNWSIALGAFNYAGLSNSTSLTVHVIVPFAQSVSITSAAKGTLGAFTGISVSATNLWTSGQNLVVFAVFKNSAGQTVAVATGGLTLGAGASGTAFATSSDLSGLPSGSYTVSVFIITTSNNPVSSSTSISVSI